MKMNCLTCGPSRVVLTSVRTHRRRLLHHPVTIPYQFLHLKTHRRHLVHRSALTSARISATSNSLNNYLINNVKSLGTRPLSSLGLIRTLEENENIQRRWLSSTPTPSPENQNDNKPDTQHPSTSDPPILTWVDDHLPKSWIPYARLARVDKPIGTWLLLWPCFWSTALASPPLPQTAHLMGLFTAGAFVMRGAGCTINDLWDQDFDKRVERTLQRPLANGDVTTNQAIQFLALQLGTGLVILTSFPNTVYTFWWGAASLPLVVIYPLAKRFTNWPQLVLGLTFNWGAWMGWATTYGSMDYSICAPLYGSGVTWTLVYDTLYAHQDKKDDKALGLKSTALTFGADDGKNKQVMYGFATLTWLQWLAVGYTADLSTIYYVGSSAAYSHLLWQVHTADLNNPQNLADRFRSNATVGALLFGSIVGGNII